MDIPLTNRMSESSTVSAGRVEKADVGVHVVPLVGVEPDQRVAVR
jgi:hypothetical protein